MLRRVEQLITQIRLQSENQEFSDTAGISDNEIIQYLNDAQHRLQTTILKQHPNVMTKEKIISAVQGQSAYELPSDAYLSNKVVSVEFSPTGRDQDYFPLDWTVNRNRVTGIQGTPSYYIRKSGSIYLVPEPQSSISTIRLNYVKRVDQLDKRRGTVDVAVLSGLSITSLTLDLSGNPPVDFDSLNLQNYICIVDRNGNMKMRNIEIDSISSSTGIVSVTSGFVFESGETIPAGSYVVGGQDTTTNSEMERNCERYILAYGAWKLMKRDSSIDSTEQENELLAMETEIAGMYADVTDDIIGIPILQSWS